MIASSELRSKARSATRTSRTSARTFARRAVVAYRIYRGRDVGRLLAGCAPLLPTVAKPRAVLVVSLERRHEIGRWVARLPRYRVLVVGEGAVGLKYLPRRVTTRPAATLPEIQEAVRSFGGLHLVVDLRSSDIAGYRETWRALFLHLRRDGVHLIPRAATVSEAELTAWTGEIAAREPAESADAPLFEATRKTALRPDVLALVKDSYHHVALGDDEVAVLLPLRERGVHVELLHELPAGTFASRAQVSSYGASVDVGALNESFEHPPLRLRRYTGPIVFAGRTLMYSGSSILPESFRFYRAGTLDHPVLKVAASGICIIPPGTTPRDELDGDYLVIDAQWSGHFGHVMTEVVPRLWAWDEAKARYPDLKVLFALPRGKDDDPLVRRLLLAYGIAETDIVGVKHPVRVRSLLTASAMWHNQRPHFVHPGLTDVWDRIGAGLIGPTPAAGPERIFISRHDTTTNRSCRNSADVEQYFESFGFTVIYPEDLDLAEQAAVFRGARVIAGFGGSNMFSLMYSQRLEHLILLNQEAYTARNEHLYSALLGGPVSYFWSTPEVQHSPDGWNPWAFISGWSFDFERNGAALEKVLTGLAD